MQFASCNCGREGICISEAQYYCLIDGRCHNAPQHEYRPRATSSQLSRMLFRFARMLGKITTRFSFVYVILEGVAKVEQARSPTGSEMSQQYGSGRPGRIQNT